MVVTDRYPPDSHGGAELSLHTMLREIDCRYELLVVTSREVREARAYRLDGVQVLVLPAQGQWPQHRDNEVTARRTAALRLDRKHAQRHIREARNPELTSLLRAKPPRGGLSLEYMGVPEGLGAASLRAVLKTCGAELVHADNYRSILVAAHAIRGTRARAVGLVRDNRFHCARHSQSVYSHGARCGECDFRCAAEDAHEAPELLAVHLDRIARFRREALSTMHAVIVTSEYLERSVRPLVPGRPLFRLPNSPDTLERVRSPVTTTPQLPGTNLLVVGMLNENKGQLALVELLPQLAARIPDVRLHLAGKGTRIAAQIHRASHRLGQEHRVVMHGYLERDALYELYRACQIVVLPTVWPEPFGRVPLEAGLARRPCVAFAVGGLVESIEDGVTGVLIPPGDHEGLVAAIAELARSPARQLELGEAAFRHVQATYAIDRHASTLPEIWREVIAGKSR